jgi:hypothetical protein
MYHTHYKLAGLGLFCVLLVVASIAVAQSSGKVIMHATSVAVGVGAQWGQGTLTLHNGKQYPFTIQGLEVGGLGVSEVNATGEVYNLQNLSDFNGVYAAAEANAAVGRGQGVRTMRNEHGVVIDLSSVQQGVKLTLAGEGVRIALK